MWIPTSFRCTTAGVQSHISIIEISYAFLFLCTECSYDPACPSQLTYSSYTKCRPHYTLQHSHSQCKSICWSVCHTRYNITQYVPSHGNRSSQWVGRSHKLTVDLNTRPQLCPKLCTTISILQHSTFIVCCTNLTKKVPLSQIEQCSFALSRSNFIQNDFPVMPFIFMCKGYCF